MTSARRMRPPVSVVMPFAGTREDATAAIETLERLHVSPNDQLLLADNAGVLADANGGGVTPPAAERAIVTIVAATGERSPAHARNTGAAASHGDAEWILFLDADTIAPPDLIDRYFAEPIENDVGALAGGVRAAPPAAGARPGLAGRYGAHKNFLDAGAHLAHPFMPRAAAANLLVRRSAFDAVGGFFEGLRAAEDTDFCWRLQLAGWRLAGRPEAVVEHRYRASLASLRRQWRSYAAGRAWLSRRYQGFAPRPALLRAGARMVAPARRATPPPAALSPASKASPATRAAFAALDALLGVEELIGFTQSNRPAGTVAAPSFAQRVLVADRFPAPGDTAQPGDRVEAAARPERAQAPPTGVTVVYREDDGVAERAAALTRVALAAPGRTAAAIADDAQATVALAPAALRLRAAPETTLAALQAGATDAARHLSRLAGARGDV
jgi:hypothetical protein